MNVWSRMILLGHSIKLLKKRWRQFNFDVCKLFTIPQKNHSVTRWFWAAEDIPSGNRVSDHYYSCWAGVKLIFSRTALINHIRMFEFVARTHWKDPQTDSHLWFTWTVALATRKCLKPVRPWTKTYTVLVGLQVFSDHAICSGYQRVVCISWEYADEVVESACRLI